MKHSSWCSWRTVLVMTLLREGVWKSLVSVATELRWFLRTMCFNTRRSSSVSLCGLSLRGWASAAPRHFHLKITALEVDRGSSSRSEIWRTDLLERWHPMTVPRWKSLSSLVRPFYCQCLSMEIAWPCARYYTPFSNGCGWNSRIYKFQEVSTYIYTYSLLGSWGITGIFSMEEGDICSQEADSISKSPFFYSLAAVSVYICLCLCMCMCVFFQ